MTSEQINLIQTSFQTVTKHTADFAEIFYDRLFTTQPVLRLMLPTNIDEQKQKLSAMLEMIVVGLENFGALMPTLESLGRRHALYGVREDHYEIAGSALIGSLASVIGDDEFTAETRDAWMTMYYRVVDVMKRSARELDHYEIKQLDEQHQIYEVKPATKKIGGIASVFASLVFFILVFAGSASAVTYTVTKTADTNDGICNADCSLREAITAANAGSGFDLINFNIPGGGVKTITLINIQFPSIVNPVTIDGTTQPGYAGSPLIELNGNNVVNYGLILYADATVRGLAINRCLQDGVAIGFQGASPNVLITGTYIGTNAAGTSTLPNAGEGISIYSAGGTVTIGGTGANERNVISGNGGNGILLAACNFFGGPTVNILGNNIGVDWTGNLDLGNTLSGINDQCSVAANIGGTTAAARNVISGNDSAGIALSSGNAVVRGNYIGTSSTGVFALGNSVSGIYVSASNGVGNIIGGSSLNAGNTISGNTGDGITLYQTADTTTIQGNKIGTRPTGTASMPNSMNGIFIGDDTNVLIGGTTSGLGNLISGNTQNGILIEGQQATNISIKGNQIGVSADSLSKIANGADGVHIESKGIIVGEAGIAAASNIIAGNTGNGITLKSANAFNNVVENNFVGTNSAGTNLANGGNGVFIDGGSHDNFVGGANSTGANTILFNALAGVKITGGATTINNAVRNNAISQNGGLGIDLETAGVTANDVGDGDIGANNLQNFPVIQSAYFNRVIGTLNSQPNKTYTVEIYRNNVCDASNNGEGQFNLGSQTVVTDASGNAVIDMNVSLAQGQIVSATATDASGNTSEFAKCFTATALPGSLGFSSPTFSVNENGATATITVSRSFGSGGMIGVNYATTNGTAVAGQDYTATSGGLIWADGDTASKTFTVPVTNDTLDEANETVNVTLSNPSLGVGLLTSTAVLTINDDDVSPTLSVNDITKAEGNQGTTNFTFNITLSTVSGQTVVVDYMTANGTATAGIDYAFNGDTIVFNPGETVKPITITVYGDTLAETDETFFVELQDPQNATFGDSHGVGMIQDDDNAGKLQFGLSGTVSESAGTTSILVSRTGGTAGTVSVDYSTSNGTATAGADYTATSGTLVLLDGVTSASFLVTILPDNIGEANETVFLTLSNPNGGAVLGNPSTRILTIIDDDGGLPQNVSIGGKVLENNAALPNVVVTLSGSQTKTTLTDAQGKYSFANLQSGGNYLVTPTLNGHNFEPFDLSYAGLATNVANADFTATTGSPARTIRVVTTDTVSGGQVVVPVELVSQGNENSVGFSLNYDPNLLSNAQVSLGTDAAAGSLIVNAGPTGQIGVIVALPAGQAFTAGTRRVANVTFLTAQTALYSTPLTFGDAPTPRETSDANASALPTGYSNGAITFAQGYEADVAPRPTGSGNGTITVGDYTQVGKFVAGTSTLDANYNEFQRADSAPRGTKGNGFLTVSDYTQAGRYAAGLDPVQTAGGTSIANLFAEDYEKTVKSKAHAISVPRVIRVVNTQAGPGTQVLVSLEIDASGEENGFGFTLNYDPTKLANPLVTTGNGTIGANLIPNTNQAGKVGVVLAFPVNQSIQPGTKQLVTVRFDVAANAMGGQTFLTFGSQPVFQEVVDVNADVLATAFNDGSITILGPSAATVNVGGRVTDVNGKSIRNAVITLAASNGQTRLARTGSFGYYTFADVAAGETYLVTIQSKTYQFTPATQLITVNDDMTEINFAAN